MDYIPPCTSGNNKSMAPDRLSLHQADPRVQHNAQLVEKNPQINEKLQTVAPPAEISHFSPGDPIPAFPGMGFPMEELMEWP